MIDGYVYLIAKEDGLVKIGYSSDPIERLSQMQVSNTQRMKILAIIPTSRPREMEKRLHEFFETWNVGGEWFRLSEADLGTALVVAKKVENWFTRLNIGPLNSTKLFTKDDVARIVKERVDRLQRRNASGAKAKLQEKTDVQV